MSDTDVEQNTRLRELEQRVNSVENDLSAILAKLATVESIGKGLMMVCGALFGIEVIPMVGV